jgi:hypothetical protein
MNEELRQAAEAVKDPTSYSLLTYSWVVLLSAWGGTVRFIRKVKAGDMTVKQALFTLAGEIVTSSFAGVVTFYGCEALHTEPLYTAMLVGIAGHMGGRALEPLEKVYKRWFGASADKD